MGFLRNIGLVTLLLFSNAISATLIVDTGSGSDSPLGWSLYGSQWLGGQFTLDNDTTLTQIDGWIGQDIQGDITLQVWDASISTELYASVFDSGTIEDNTWRGVSNMSLDLGAGSYWATFSLLGTSTFQGVMNFTDLTNPLDAYAYYQPNTVDPAWVTADGTIGLQVYGDFSPVPLPAAAWLFGSGLLGLIGLARRKNK